MRTTLEAIINGSELPTQGLCEALDYGFPVALFDAWPHFSGNRGYPINDEDSSYTPSQQYCLLPHCEDNQLTLRLQLAQFMLDHLNAPYTLEELNHGLR